jgi:acetoacetyl-CoA synthetase
MCRGLLHVARRKQVVENVGEAARARQKQAKSAVYGGVNEHFEPAFNAAMATQVVFQQPAWRAIA